jgi:serine/threonine-protein kinase
VASESGRNEVYVRPFPGPGAATQISTDGGDEPVWAPSGRELFFRRGDALMAVSVGVAGGSLTAGQPQELFSGSYLAGGVRAGYDVSPDGQRFVLVKASQARLDLTRFNIVVNWLDEMTARLSK